MFRTVLFAASIAATTVLATKHYDIVNNCPSEVTLYINGASQGLLSFHGGTTSRDFPDNFSGLIYTDANGGTENGTSTTRAGFFGQDNYYYLVVDSEHLNTGVSIFPISATPLGGFCSDVTCDSASCPGAFTQPPTAFPTPSSTPPTPPLLACPSETTGYRVTFCPSGAFPGAPAGPNTIHPNGDVSTCLEVRSGVFANGTAVQVFDCNGTPAQNWMINRGNTQVRLNGTGFCLDAGSNPGNNVGMKIWTCFDGLPAQQWFYTDDNRIALTGQGQCLDLPGGNLTNGNQVQTFKCTDFNTNQIWTTL